MMMRVLLLASLLVCASAIPAKAACDCLEYPDVKLMLRSSDFAYVGEWMVPEYTRKEAPADAPVRFKVTEVLAGPKNMLDQKFVLDRKKDVEAQCRTFTTSPKGSFLVFGSMYDETKPTFLTDCRNDIVTVLPDQTLSMRGKQITVKLEDLRSETRDKLASEMTEDEAIEAATNFASSEKQYEREKYGVLNTQYKDTGGFRPYWIVRFSEYPPVANSKVFRVKLYTSGKTTMTLKDEEAEQE